MNHFLNFKSIHRFRYAFTGSKAYIKCGYDGWDTYALLTYTYSNLQDVDVENFKCTSQFQFYSVITVLPRL